jgi:hypothetical protein
MLTRVLFAVVLMCGMASVASAEDVKVLALGITTHEVTQAELETGATLPAPHFNTPAIAYVLATNLEAGDVVEIALANGETSLLHNIETLTEDKPKYLLQAGKGGVPAGGWPEGTYHAKVTIVRDGKTLIEQTTAPIPLD